MTTLQEVQEKLLQAELAYAEKYITLASGLTQSDIDAMASLIGTSSLGVGAFGFTEGIQYKGKDYLRKTVAATPEVLNEVKIMKLLTGNPMTRMLVPFFYGYATKSIKGIQQGHIIMEKLVGKTLGELMNQRGLTEEEAKKIEEQLQFMLEIFHDEGYVHRDIHAGNIFILMDGNTLLQPVLIDFGRSIYRKRSTEFNIELNSGFSTRYNNNARLSEIFRPSMYAVRQKKNYIRNKPQDISHLVSGVAKPRNAEAFRLSEEAIAELKPYAQEVTTLKQIRDGLLEETGETRRTTWLASLRTYNNTKKNQRKKNANRHLLRMMSEKLFDYDIPEEAKKTVIALQDDILLYVTTIFDTLRGNGVQYYVSLNKSIELGEAIMTAFFRGFSDVYKQTKSIEQGLVQAQKNYEAAKEKGLQEIGTITTPTSFYGGRRSTRRRRNRGTRRKRNVQSS